MYKMLPNDVAIMAFADGGMAAGRRARRRLRPRRRAVDRAAMRPDRDYVWQQALRWKVAGDVFIVGGYGAEFFAGALMRIEHDDGFSRSLLGATGLIDTGLEWGDTSIALVILARKGPRGSGTPSKTRLN